MTMLRETPAEARRQNVFTLYARPEDRAALQELAELTERSMSDALRRALHSELKRQRQLAREETQRQ